MKPFVITGVQMYLNAGNNVDAMCARLDVVMQLFPWTQMVLFSELAPFGPGVHHAVELPGPTEARFQETARRHGIWLIPGSMCERYGEHTYNTLSVIDPWGEVVARYRKMYPFLPYETGIRAGERFVTFDVPDVGRFGVSICYDMWFPETTRTLAAMGAEVILHPSLTPTIDRDVELAIARASAATNQCYFFDINGLGAGGVGRSVVLGPDGEVVLQAGAAPQVMPIEIDLERVRRSREVGLLGLGQPLKQFRDQQIDFPVYRADGARFLDRLGPLEKPKRGTRRGLSASASPLDPAAEDDRPVPREPVEAQVR